MRIEGNSGCSENNTGFTDTYRYAHQVPLRNTGDAVMANWLERATTDARGTLVFENAWATSHAIADHNVAALAPLTSNLK